MKIGKLRLCSPVLAALLLSSVCAFAAERSANDEEQVGNAAAAKILGSTKLLPSQATQSYVNTLGASIAALSERPALRWRFAVIDSPDINAFAAPGGIVLVTRGLLKLLDTEDELAAVLCHEIGHVVRKHHYNVILRQRLADEATRQMAAGEKDNELNELSHTSSVIYARGLDKGAEFDADLYAMQLLAKAGYDASALLGVLEKLRSLHAGDGRAELLFSTHPSPADRLDHVARAGAEGLPQPSPAARRNARFQAAKSRL